MLVTWDTGSAYTNQPSLSWQTWRTPEKLNKWYGDREERGESCKPRLNPRPEKWFFPDPRFPQKSPKMGEGQFFPPLPQKMPILFHSGNKRLFKVCPQSVSTYQNQLVEAEKLFKKVTFLPDSTIYVHIRHVFSIYMQTYPIELIELWFYFSSTVRICYSVGLWFSKIYHYNRCITTSDVHSLRSNRKPLFPAWAFP